jgi:hypothetical protein
MLKVEKQYGKKEKACFSAKRCTIHRVRSKNDFKVTFLYSTKTN